VSSLFRGNKGINGLHGGLILRHPKYGRSREKRRTQNTYGDIWRKDEGIAEPEGGKPQ
jgi:hypothetical protein